MKILLLVLLSVVAINSLSAQDTVICHLSSHPFDTPPNITLSVGQRLCIHGDTYQSPAQEEEAQQIGKRYWNGDHYVKYEDNLGGKELRKKTYNFSLWRLDDTSLDNDYLTCEAECCCNDKLGRWDFKARAVNSEPEKLCFINKEGEVAIIKVTVKNLNLPSAPM